MTDSVCPLKEAFNNKEAEDFFSSASFPSFFNCFINCPSKNTKACKFVWNKATRYLRLITDKYPWFLPSGKYGISHLSTLSEKDINIDTHKRIENEKAKRLEFTNTSNVRNDIMLPNPGVLIVNVERDTCYLSNFIKRTDLTLDAIKTPDSSISYLQKAEELYSKKANILPVYDIAISASSPLQSPITGNSAMLPYYIKRWFEDRGLEPDGKIAATGGIITDDNEGKPGDISAVDGLTIKLKSAIEIGYRYIFYPECQSDEVREKLGKIAENTTKLIPISNIYELEQRLLFLSEYRLALSVLQQYLEGTRNKISIKDKKKHLRSYFKGILKFEKRSNLFKQLQSLFYSCESLIPSRKKEILNIFFELIEDCSIEASLTSSSNLTRYKVSFIKTILPKPVWYSLLPFIIQDLHDNEENNELKQELYLRNLEKFYNHDICATISGRLSFKLRYITNFWQKSRSFANEFKHIWGICSFDPLSLASELSNINERNNFEEDLLIKTLLYIFKTDERNELAIPSVGTNPYPNDNTHKYPGLDIANDYFTGLKETIDSIFPGFEPKKFRYLRWDQRMGSLCRILYNLSQQNKSKPHYLEYEKKLIKLLEKTLATALFDYYRQDDCRPVFQKFKSALLSLTQYENKDKIMELYQLAFDNISDIRKNKAKDDSLARNLKSLAEQYEEAPKGQTSIIDNIKVFISNQNLINSIFNELKENMINFSNSSYSSKICINPIYDLAKLYISPNEDALKHWLNALNSFCADFENIFNISGTSLALALFAGLYYKGEIPQNLCNNKYTNIFLIGHYLRHNKHIELKSIANISDDIDKYAISLLLQGGTSEGNQDLQKLSAFFNNFNASDYNSNCISNIPDSIMDTNKNCIRRWKLSVEDYMLQTTRTQRKNFYLLMLNNYPMLFLRLPFAELDPENYSLTLLYLIAFKKYYNSKDQNLFKKIEKKIFFYGKNLFDQETIKTVKLLYFYINEDYHSIKRLLYSNKLGFMNMKVALLMLNQIKR